MLLVRGTVRRTLRVGTTVQSKRPANAPVWTRALSSQAGGASRSPPGLVSLTGAPLRASTPGANDDPALGSEVELTQENAMQVLKTKAPILLQVGKFSDVILKKVNKLRLAASGRLPLVTLDCAKLPEICQALQMTSDAPAIFLMAQGQVAAALEGDVSPQQATAFAERVAELLGVQVDLTEGVTEQLLNAEELEWLDAAAAEEAFGVVLGASDLSKDARVRASAGQARCALRRGGLDEAKGIIEELEHAGHKAVPEVKQASAMLVLYDKKPQDDLQSLASAYEAADAADLATKQAYAVALFWANKPGDAFDVGIKILRRKRSEEIRKLVLSLLEGLGPRHPRYAKARRSFSNALFA